MQFNMNSVEITGTKVKRKLTCKPLWAQLPHFVLANIFSFLPLEEIKSCSLVCRSWNMILSDENNYTWQKLCRKRLSGETLTLGIFNRNLSCKSKLKAYCHSWNPDDCSKHMYVKQDGFTLHRNPVARSTDGARSKIGFKSGRHCWEIWWQSPLGTVAMIGIASKKASMHCSGYVALLGKDDHSWGWNIVENLLIHHGETQGKYPINKTQKYQVEERIRVILDCDDNTLAFEKNYEFLGVAFRNLPNNVPLYPAVSAVYGNTEICMIYLGCPIDG